MTINTEPLHPTFGVIAKDVDLNEVTRSNLYPEIRELFENHSAILYAGGALAWRHPDTRLHQGIYAADRSRNRGWRV